MNHTKRRLKEQTDKVKEAAADLLGKMDENLPLEEVVTEIFELIYQSQDLVGQCEITIDEMPD